MNHLTVSISIAVLITATCTATGGERFIAFEQQQLPSELACEPPSATNINLKCLVADKDDSIALNAFWATLIHEVRQNTIVEKVFAGRLDGFILGRIRVTAPKWWLKASLYSSGLVQDENHRYLRRLNKKWNGKGRWHYFEAESAIQEGEFLQIRRGEHVVNLSENQFDDFAPADPLEHWKPSVTASHFTASWDESSLFIAFLASPLFTSSPELLHCVNVDTGELKWSAKIENGIPKDIGISSTGRGGFAQIVVQGDRVAIFSVNLFSCSVNVYDKRNGNSLAKFASKSLHDRW